MLRNMIFIIFVFDSRSWFSFLILVCACSCLFFFFNLLSMTSIVRINRKFEFMKKVKLTAIRWTVDANTSFIVWKNDSKRWIAICRKFDICDSRLRMSKSAKNDEIKIIKLIFHICSLNTHRKLKHANSVKVLNFNDLVVAAVADNKNLLFKIIQTIERHHHDNKIYYKTDWRTREKIRVTLYEKEKKSFQLLFSLMRACRKNRNDVKCHVIIVIDENTKKFDRCIMISIAIIEIFKHCRKIIFIDDTHTFVRHQQIILRLTILNENNNVLKLAWVCVFIENKDIWIWFLKHVAKHFLDLKNLNAVVISDRSKEILSAMNQMFSTTIHAFCVQHICENVSVQWLFCRKFV